MLCEALRQEVDQTTHLGGEVPTMRIDRMNGESFRLVGWQQPNECAGNDILSDDETRRHEDTAPRQSEAPQKLAAVGDEIAVDPHGFRLPIGSLERPIIAERREGVAQAIMVDEIFRTL